MFDGMSTPELFFLFLAAGAGFLGVRHLIQVIQARQQAPGAQAPRTPTPEPVSDWPAQAPAGQTPAGQAPAGQAPDTAQWFRRGADDAPAQGSHPAHESPQGDHAAGAPRAAEAGERPWYTVLEVSPTAPMEDIRQAYKRKMRQYHPDKLAGLGDELLAVAEVKTKEINRAYAKALDGR